MGSANEDAEVNQAQRTYARLAGLLLLAAIILAPGSGAVLSKIAGNGSFAETAARIAASERSYRVALSCVVIVTLGSPSTGRSPVAVSAFRIQSRLAPT